MTMPLPPGTPPITLSVDETTLILRQTLRPVHADDPNVLMFIERYLSCRDPRQAAVEAGLTPHSGVNLRARPDIFEAIRQLTEKAVMKYGYDATEVVEKVKEIAFIDPAEFERPDGSYVESLRELRPEVRRAVKKFKCKNIYDKDPNGMNVVTGKLIEVELHDKMKAVELLGREKEIFKETKKIEHDVTKNMADVLLASRERGEQAALTMRDVTQPIKPEELA